MKKPIRILIVEDSEADAKLLLLELQRNGYDPIWERVQTAEAMQAALDREPWDIVLSDYHMPRFNGLEALEILQESAQQDIPFILVSGIIGEELAVEAVKAGVDDYIMKNKLARLAPTIAREIGVRRERRRAAQEKAHLEKQLQQSQKLQSIGTLAGGIAHNFNNMLGVILGYAELLAMDTPTTPKEQKQAKERAKRIIQSGKRARDLVKQILTFSRQRKQEIKRVALQTLVEETLQLLRSSLPTSLEMRTTLAAENFSVMGDPVELQQVLMNLCTNASHAIGEKKGVIEVILERFEVNKTYAPFHPNLAQGHFLRLSVSDSGKGIAPKDLPYIFEPFFTTKAVKARAWASLSPMAPSPATRATSAFTASPAAAPLLRFTCPAWKPGGRRRPSRKKRPSTERASISCWWTTKSGLPVCSRRCSGNGAIP